MGFVDEIKITYLQLSNFILLLWLEPTYFKRFKKKFN